MRRTEFRALGGSRVYKGAIWGQQIGNPGYYDFKRRNGYSEDEILHKREALENVLVPYRADENVELFRHSGFQIVETFFQWYNFCGFLCVKSAQD